MFFARLWLKKIELDPGGDFSDQGNGGMDVEQKSADWRNDTGKRDEQEGSRESKGRSPRRPQKNLQSRFSQ